MKTQARIQICCVARALLQVCGFDSACNSGRLGVRTNVSEVQHLRDLPTLAQHLPKRGLLMKSSRRKFLQSTLAAPVALALGGPAVEPLDAIVFPSPQMTFENPDFIRYDAHCFTINGRDTFIHGGCMHYTRCPQSLWRDRLLKFKRAGFNTVESYVFWNYHEPQEGHADFTLLESFIQLVKEMASG